MMFDVELLKDWNKVKNHVVVRLCSEDFDAEVYEDATNYGFKGLKLVPYINIAVDDENGSIKITKALLDLYDISRKEVIKQGISNLNVKMGTMEEMMGLPESPFIIITNNEMWYGASSIIAARKTLDEKFENGYVVLPSSVHEVLVLPREVIPDMDDVIEMVRNINELVLKPDEVLSNDVYEF